MIPLDGPFYDQLSVGDQLPRQPSVVIDEGMAALYQAIMGERLPMVLDPATSLAVTGHSGRLASAGLVMQLSIGQSTTVSRRAIANLFFRDVRLVRPVSLGESIATTVTVAALADSRARPGRAHRGKVLVDVVTTAAGEPAVTYRRAPMLPQIGDTQPGHAGEFGAGTTNRRGSTAATLPDSLAADYSGLVPSEWDFTALGPPVNWKLGSTVIDPARDVIDNALGLVRLTHNLALIHRDATRSPYPERLVYGGHVVGLAQASLSRVLPGMATVVGWHGCDHTGPAFEGDQVSFRHTLLDVAQAGSGRVFVVHVEGFAHRGDVASPGSEPEPDSGVAILDWTVAAAAP